MGANGVEKFAYFFLRFPKISQYYNCDFDNNFAAISNEFLDATRFRNLEKKLRSRNLNI